MIEKKLSTLKIHKLTKAQYDREVSNGTIDENALYLTPDEEIDLSSYATAESVSSTYETKDDSSNKLSEAKAYADTAAIAIKNDLLNGAGESYDTLKELGDLINENTDALQALETVATGKADKADVTALQELVGETAVSEQISTAIAEIPANVLIKPLSTIGENDGIDFFQDSNTGNLKLQINSTTIDCGNVVYKNDFPSFSGILSCLIMGTGANSKAYMLMIEIYENDFVTIKNYTDKKCLYFGTSHSMNSFEYDDEGNFISKTSSNTATTTDVDDALASAKSYTDEALATKADTSHSHDDVYETKTDAQTKLDTANTYTDSAVSGLASTSSVNTSISTHNTSTSAHNDIRALITDLTTKLNNFLDVDDTTTDQLSEVLTLIENNKGTLESLTTNKVNVSDIVNNLTTNSTSKVLSAAQGVTIKALIDALQEELDTQLDSITDAKADWNQNDETSIDYIKNRTHWTEDDGTVHKLDNKYSKSNVEGQTFTYKVGESIISTTKTASQGAEIYNNYTDNVAIGANSHAEGSGTKALGLYSHAEGWDTEASGSYAPHAEGYSTVASGHYSHAEGSSTTASGLSSHAEGVDTEASGDYSHAEGSSTTASGHSSHAEGNGTVASGDFSHAAGYHTTSLANQYVIGHYNGSGTAGSSTGTTGDAFIIGKGTSSSGSNAFRVSYAGKVFAVTGAVTSGADYAEFFEWKDSNLNNEDRRGYFVTLDGDKIKIAEPNDYILGIVSGMPCVIGNGDECWRGRYIQDEFGAFITEEFEYEEEVMDEETREIKTITKTGTKYKENPDYDPTRPYIQREDRPEWDTVGMVGVLSVRDDGTCNVNGFCKVTNGGIATASENGYRVISRVNENIVKVVFK